MSVERIMINGHELTAFDLPPEPSETYTVNVDGLGEVVVEKGKPPKEKDVPAMYMRKLVPELCEQNATLFCENAKLRELVEDMLDCIDIQIAFERVPARCMQNEFAGRAHELGIEVDA